VTYHDRGRTYCWLRSFGSKDIEAKHNYVVTLSCALIVVLLPGLVLGANVGHECDEAEADWRNSASAYGSAWELAVEFIHLAMLRRRGKWSRVCLGHLNGGQYKSI